MRERDSLRDGLASKIGKLSYERLLSFGITRCASIGGLDRIGLPGHTVTRPTGRTLAISSGKGLTIDQSRSSAILEGIELWAAENPQGHSPIYSWNGMTAVCMPKELRQLALDAPFHDDTPISWDTCYHVRDNCFLWVPSDLVWMVQRAKTPFLYFQSSSNGLASGVNRRDAELSALYEVVERDAWTIADVLEKECGQWPDRVSTDDLPYPLDEIVGKMFSAGLYPFLFDITTDLQVPAFKCLLCDPTENTAGMFAGHGCDLNASTAAKRALLEAAQSRVCYIAGARDDLFRRHFLILKGTDQKKLIEQLSAIPLTSTAPGCIRWYFGTIEDEWESLIERLKMFGITEIYSKELYKDPELGFSIVRVVAPQLEPSKFEHWTPGPRARKALEAYV